MIAIAAPTAACSATPLHTFREVLAHSYTGVNCDDCPLTERLEGVDQTEGVAEGITGHGARSSGAAQRSTKASMVNRK